MMGKFEDFGTWLRIFEEMARVSSPEIAALGDTIMDYEAGWSAHTGDADTNMFLASARTIVLEMAKRIHELEDGR